MSTSKPWPPPPDLDSLEELVAAVDVEGFIADGAPADEYETEASTLFATLRNWPTAELTTERMLPLLEETWAAAFALGEPGLNDRRVKLRELAGQIERFFGPGAAPQMRGA